MRKWCLTTAGKVTIRKKKLSEITEAEEAKQSKSGDHENKHREGREEKTEAERARQPKSGDREKEQREGHKEKAKPEGAKRTKSGDREKEHCEGHEKKEAKSTDEKAATSVKPKAREDECNKHTYEKNKETRGRNETVNYKCTTVDGGSMEIRTHSKRKEVAGLSDVVLVGVQMRDTRCSQTLPQPTNENQMTHFGAKVSTAASKSRSVAHRKEDQKTCERKTSGAGAAKERQGEVKQKDEEKLRKERRREKRVNGEEEQEEGGEVKAETKVKKERKKESINADGETSQKGSKDVSVNLKTNRATADDQKGRKISDATKRENAANAVDDALPVKEPNQNGPEKKEGSVTMRHRSFFKNDIEKRREDQRIKYKSMVVNGSAKEFPSLETVQSSLRPGNRRTMLLNESRPLGERVSCLHDL
uniref:Uncharacterized protein n=1 Tax=Schistocephalus solidus TaxID=70667 RepID=A0A0X3P967_SCHSO